MSGCFALNLNISKDYLNKIEINGFKFLYELLSVSKGALNISEVPLKFNERISVNQNLILRLFGISSFLLSTL